MTKRPTFSQYLVGQASLERPAFFYAYAGMWVHLLIGSLVLIAFFQLPILSGLATLTISSFSLGIVIYGLVSREFGLLVNVISYALTLSRTFAPEQMGIVFLIVAIISSIVSAYMLISREYNRYSVEHYGNKAAPIPIWISVTMGIVVVLLCIYGLNVL